MSFRQPPRLAVWLLNFLRVSTGNEPLTGDLLEEFRRGRTAGWYWRQALMAIAVTFCQRFRAYRQDLLEMFVGWCAETSVVVALWIFNIPLGPRSLVLGFPGLAIIWLVMYAEYRVRLYLWVNDGASDEESDENWQRKVSPRLGILYFFGYFVLSDAVVAVLCMLPGRNFSLPLIIMFHGCWLCRLVITRLRRTS
jgi:hypothetical protein